MNNIEENKIIITKTKRYIHLTKSEITNFTKKYATNSSRIIEYKKFQLEFRDLKEFEIKLWKKDLPKDFINTFNWSIMVLAYYNRITIPANIIFKITIHLYEFNKIDDEIIYLEGEFNKILHEKYNYSKSYIRSILCLIIRMKLFYQKSIKSCCENINEYLELVNEYSSNKHLAKAIVRFLNEIGYIKVEDNFFIREECTDLNSKNTSSEFKRYLNNYLIEILNTKALKTFRSTKSHLKSFFDFMEAKFPCINKIEELNNEHIREYINYLKITETYFKKPISPATINARLEECAKFFSYIERNVISIDSLKIITKYDKVREHKTLPKYVSKKDVLRLLEAINKIDEEKYIQEKLIIILMVDTGRRFHEVRVLSHSCLKDGNFIYFHKTKTGSTLMQKVGVLSVKAVLKAQKICSNINKEIYSKDDNMKIRRLFPAIKDKFRIIVGKRSVEKLFKDIQIKSGIVDYNNKPLFTLHDNKRNFISNMESSGVTAAEIAKLLNQSIETIAQYEVRNDKAIKVLKKIEEKGTLIGKEKEGNIKIEEERIYGILNQQEIIQKNRLNLIEKIQNPKEVVPLPLGQCTQIENILFCGQVFCMACDNYTLVTDNDKEAFKQFCEKFYIHMYMYRRDERIKEIHKKFEEITKKVLTTNKIVDEINFNKYINEIKKQSRMKVGNVKNGKL